MDAHARDPNAARRPSAPAAARRARLCSTSRARFFKAAGKPKSVRAVVGGVRALLDAALEQAAREIERHMPEAAPLIGEDGAAPWLEVAEAAKGAGVDERDPRFKTTILDYFDATDFRPKPTSVTTPWCGAFAAHCMKASGNRTAAASVPKGAAAAASWKSWGTGAALAIAEHSRGRGRRALPQPRRVFLRARRRPRLPARRQSERQGRQDAVSAKPGRGRALAQSGSGPSHGRRSAQRRYGRPWARFRPRSGRPYLDKLGEMESGNNYGAVNRLGYCGRWQFGAGALIDTGYVRAGTTNRALALARRLDRQGRRRQSRRLAVPRPDAQDAAMLTYTRAHYKSLLDARRAAAHVVARAHRRPVGCRAFDGRRRRAASSSTARSRTTPTAPRRCKYYEQLSVALGGSRDGWRRRAGRGARAAAIAALFHSAGIQSPAPKLPGTPWKLASRPTPRIVRARGTKAVGSRPSPHPWSVECLA